MNHDRSHLFDRAAAAEAVRRMNEDELRWLNRLIVDRLNLIHQARSTAMLSQLAVGDRVHFRCSDGGCKTGVILRLNKKTASIRTDDGQRWNVHPAYLSRLDDPATSTGQDLRNTASPTHPPQLP